MILSEKEIDDIIKNLKFEGNSYSNQMRVGKYNYKTRKCPDIPNYNNYLVHTKDDLSPYVLKDESGCLMENIWQFNKIYRKVYRQNSLYNRFRPQDGGWKYPEEVHLDDKNNVLPSYWNWRRQGMENKTPVRYPNGIIGRREVLGFIMCINGPLSSSNPEKYEYTFIPIEKFDEARVKIYYKEYARLCRMTREFTRVQNLVRSGNKIQVCEVDGPSKSDEYPFNLADNNSLLITPEIVRGWLHNSSQSFGHGVCLCVALLNGDDWLY